jgi:hypothetical protein
VQHALLLTSQQSNGANSSARTYSEKVCFQALSLRQPRRFSLQHARFRFYAFGLLAAARGSEADRARRHRQQELLHPSDTRRIELALPVMFACSVSCRDWSIRGTVVRHDAS